MDTEPGVVVDMVPLQEESSTSAVDAVAAATARLAVMVDVIAYELVGVVSGISDEKAIKLAPLDFVINKPHMVRGAAYSDNTCRRVVAIENKAINDDVRMVIEFYQRET